MLMVPVMQTGGALFLIFAALLWSWRITRIAAKPVQQTVGKMALRKSTKSRYCPRSIDSSAARMPASCSGAGDRSINVACFNPSHREPLRLQAMAHYVRISRAN